MKKVLLIIALISAALLIVAGTATAGKGGNVSAASVTVNPDPATVGQPIDVSGCGFPKHVFVEAQYESSLYYPLFTDFTTDGGCFQSQPFTVTAAGTYHVNVYDRVGKPTSRGNLIYSRTFTVNP